MRATSTKLRLFAGGRRYDVEVEAWDDAYAVSFDGKLFAVQLMGPRGDSSMVAKLGEEEWNVVLDDETETALKLSIGGQPIVLGRAQVQLEPGQPTNGKPPPAAPEEPRALLSPMFGKVLSVEVKAGDSVDVGGALIIMEAMKMETVLRSDVKVRVKEVLVKEGDGVDRGQVLMRFY